MSKQVNYNENLCSGAAIRDDKGRRISKLFEASHPKMTVGYAKNLIMPNTPTEQEFNFRQSGGGVIEDGVAVIDKVKGNSVVWNQMVKVSFTRCDDEGITSTLSSDGGVILNGVAANDGYVIVQFDEKQILSYHKVALYRDNLIGKSEVQIPSAHIPGFVISASVAGDIFTCKSQDSFESIAWVKFNSGDSFANDKIRIGIADLTQMFGAGNEPTTYEEFLSRKPKVADEYAYNEGEIVNNKVEKVVTTGRNLFDSSTAIDGKTINDTDGAEVENSLGWCSTFIPIIGGETYFCKGVRIDVQAYGVHYYDKDKQHINGVGILQNGSTFDAPINAKHIRIHGLYDSSPANAAILNLSDASFNGQYAPYEKHELDLSWVKEIKDTEGVKLFEDGMRSAGTAFDEVGKNKAVKRLGVKVFDGTEAFGRFHYSGGFYYFRLDVSTWGTIVGSQYLCNKYVYKGIGTGLLDKDKTIASYYETALCLIRDDSFENVDSFKQHLADLYAQGKPLTVIYELAEPIEVEYDEKSLTYPVVAGGTEEAIESEPSSAFRADIGYGIDAVKTILDLKARVEALEAK